MKIEILYSELTNIYGDIGNIQYLEKTFGKKNIIYTSIIDEPYFVKNNDVSLIYLGSMPDEYISIIVKELKKYKKRIVELIKKDIIFLFTGSALELCGSYIKDKNEIIKTLNLFPEIYFIRDKEKRHNSLFIGTFNNMNVVGNKSQFTHMYGENKYPFIKADERCIGMNKDSKLEGIHYHNFFATYLLGPILLLNPPFTKYLFELINYKKNLPLQDLLMKNYQSRVKDYQSENKRFLLGDHG